MPLALSNQEIAKILYQIGEFLEIQEAAFKPRAYEKAARAVEATETLLHELYQKGGLKALEKIPGVGESIAEKIEELLTTGRLKYYEELKKELPVDVEALSMIEGVGPKHIKQFWERLGVKTVEDLERAAKAGKLRKLPRMSQKLEEKILRGIAFRKEYGARFFIGEVLPQVRVIEKLLQDLKEIAQAAVAGSIRRRRETVGDCDILATSGDPKKVMDRFVSMPEVREVVLHGRTKSMVRLKNGLELDLRVVPTESFGAALQYFTGNKDHNVALRKIAIAKGLKLNEYGIWRGKKLLAGRTEDEVYQKLGLAWMAPELREMHGEIEAALRQAQGKPNGLPKLIGYEDLMGDLQTQTNWSDGANSIEEMAKAAKARGFSYIAITDHSKRLAMANGLDEAKLKRQDAEIDRVNKRLKGFTILKGIEVDILKDGSLDLSDKALAGLDVVGASVHSYFEMSRQDMMKRLMRAMENPHVDLLFHPTGRIINKRKPVDVDIELLTKTAKKTGTILEVNASERLDLKDEHIHTVVKAGVKLAVNSDAHATTQFSMLEYGIAQARRGWAQKKDIINAWPLEKMLKMLKK